MTQKTISDYIVKERKDLSFEERSKKFEQELERMSKEWGVAPGAVLQGNELSIIATPVLRDLWQTPTSSKESATSGT